MSSTVVSLLLQRYQIGDPKKATPRDRKLADDISRLLQLHDAGEILELEEQELHVEVRSENEDNRNRLVKDDAPETPPPESTSLDRVRFSQGRLVDSKTVRTALEFYQQPSSPSGYRSLPSMTERNNRLRILRETLLRRVHAKMDEGIVLRESEIQTIARELASELGVSDFNACSSWVRKFKRKFDLVASRGTKILRRSPEQDLPSVRWNN